MTDSGHHFARLTFCSWAPWLTQQVETSVGVPVGFGARRAIHRFGAALERLARG